MDYISFQVHGGASGGGPIGLVSEFLEFIEGLAGKTPPEMFATIFPGMANMENIHPMIVHFPIAFFLAFFLMECAGLLKKKPQWRYVASWLLYLGAASAVFTVMAGLLAADSVEHNEAVHDIMEDHEHIGLSILGLSLFLSIWRSRRWFNYSTVSNRFFLGLSAVLVLLVSFGADLGGLMVYSHGVSVQGIQKESSEQGTLPAEHSEGHAHGGQEPESAKGHSHGGHEHHHGGHHHDD